MISSNGKRERKTGGPVTKKEGGVFIMGKKDLQLKRIFSNKGMAASLIACANYRHGIVLDPNKLRPSNPEHITLGIDDKKNGRRKKDRSVTADLWYEYDDWDTDYGLELQSYVDYSMAIRLLNEYGTVYSDKRHVLSKGTMKEKMSQLGKDEKLRKSKIVVGYFGTDRPWDAKEKLSDYWNKTDEPEEKNPLEFIPTVFDPWKMSDEELENPNLMREFELLCKGVKYSHNKKVFYEKVLNSPRYDNLDPDLVAIILTYLNVSEKEARVKAAYVNGGGSMCKAAEELIEDWKEEGRAEGRVEERDDMRDKFASLMSAGKSSEEIFAVLFK